MLLELGMLWLWTHWMSALLTIQLSLYLVFDGYSWFWTLCFSACTKHLEKNTHRARSPLGALNATAMLIAPTSDSSLVFLYCYLCIEYSSLCMNIQTGDNAADWPLLSHVDGCVPPSSERRPGRSRWNWKNGDNEGSGEGACSAVCGV